MITTDPDDSFIPAEASVIRLLALDVDGVLTNGQLYFSNSGEETKAFSTLDGHGIKLLQSAGIKVALITGRSSELVARRADNLGIRHLVQGCEDKLTALDDILASLSLGYEDTAYIGDDWPDLACILRVKLGVTVPAAHPELLRQAPYTTIRQGGSGAVREVCDWILRAQGLYEQALQEYL